MRISELSRATGVPIPTVKFYLREGLLHPGQRTAPNQASYDASHVRRLHLVRVLVDVGGLSVAAVRSVLTALARPDLPLHDALAAAHTALPRDVAAVDERRAAARRETDAWLDTRGWRLDAATPARDDLAAALAALRQLGWEVGPEVFERYARAADAIAAEEIAYVAAAPDREAAVEATVIGTVVFERALVALRRLAEEHHSRTRFTG
ncbi:MAG TPA: MerR family transcriptional regulator [Candidatus Limnocylindria bacterium]|jgi:DNA-binding transcriptional MerR regulator